MMSGEYLAGTQVNSWTRWHEDGKVREFARYSSTGEQIELKEFNIAKQEATIRTSSNTSQNTSNGQTTRKTDRTRHQAPLDISPRNDAQGRSPSPEP